MKTINEKKLQEYLERGEDDVLEFENAEDCLHYFNVYDFQHLKTVEELKEFQGCYGFEYNGKYYHINREEALDVWKDEK